MYSVDFLY